LGQKVSSIQNISFTESRNGKFDVQKYTSGVYFITDENQNIIAIENC